MRRAHHRGDRATGFTLVELLVALALAGVISLLMLNGIGLAGRGLDHLLRRADRIEGRRSIEMLMRRALTATVATPTVAGPPAFVGGPTNLTFLSVIEDGGPGIYRFTLALDATRPKPAVTLTRQLTARSALPQIDRSVLLRDVRAFGISYYGTLSPADEPAWHRHWEGITYLPTLVRIVFDTADDAAQPPIVVRVRDAF